MIITCEQPAPCQTFATDFGPVITDLAVASIIFILVFWIGFHFVTANRRKRRHNR